VRPHCNSKSPSTKPVTIDLQIYVWYDCLFDLIWYKNTKNNKNVWNNKKKEERREDRDAKYKM
jgi:hypothetical protein